MKQQIYFFSGLMCAGLQSGLLRTIVVDAEKVADFIPVDVVINAMIVACWKRGTQDKNLNAPIPVYNCTSGATNPITWGNLLEWGMEGAKKNPVETIFW